MELYVLKGDIEEYDYDVYGVFSTKKELLKAAEKIIFSTQSNFIATEEANENYGFSGLVYYQLSVNQVQYDNKFSIYWDKESVSAYL